MPFVTLPNVPGGQSMHPAPGEYCPSIHSLAVQLGGRKLAAHPADEPLE